MTGRSAPIRSWDLLGIVHSRDRKKILESAKMQDDVDMDAWVDNLAPQNTRPHEKRKPEGDDSSCGVNMSLALHCGYLESLLCLR
mmetsp:Transcript_40229/g.106739  ORF Transcript_40229/g.106739 Transcript_40229/m.106739 type:complete len:85 (-) Transcript_40229:422-676(-)